MSAGRLVFGLVGILPWSLRFVGNVRAARTLPTPVGMTE